MFILVCKEDGYIEAYSFELKVAISKNYPVTESLIFIEYERKECCVKCYHKSYFHIVLGSHTACLDSL